MGNGHKLELKRVVDSVLLAYWDWEGGHDVMFTIRADGEVYCRSIDSDGVHLAEKVNLPLELWKLMERLETDG